jgi:hypothetical protein
VNKQPKIGLEKKVIIDTNLTIPDSFINHRNNMVSYSFYENSEYHYAKIQDMVLHIKVSPSIGMEYNLTIGKNLEYMYTSNSMRCTHCDPLYATVGNRLILNRGKFKSGDTIIGKFIINQLGTMPCDSLSKSWIYIDSCMFKYKIEQ